MIYMFLSNKPSSGGYKFIKFVLFHLVLYKAWVKVQNFQNPELLKLAVCLLNIHNYKSKWPIVFRQTVYK